MLVLLEVCPYEDVQNDRLNNTYSPGLCDDPRRAAQPAHLNLNLAGGTKPTASPPNQRPNAGLQLASAGTLIDKRLDEVAGFGGKDVGSPVWNSKSP
jgi:hypothetical protein